jgi:hypothetical protein
MTFTYEEATDANNFETVWGLINTGVDARSACYFAYYVPGNLLCSSIQTTATEPRRKACRCSETASCRTRNAPSWRMGPSQRSPDGN